MKESRYADLATIVAGEGEKTLVLLHGYGADHRDLAPLATPLSRWRTIFPCGPIDVPIGPHMTGKAWFPIDMMRLQMVLMSGQDNPYDNITPPGLQEAAETVLTFLRALEVAPENLVLGGFSQGSMVALETALKMPTPPAGLALLSSSRTSGERWEAMLKEKGKSLRVFQSHGRMDPVLPVGSAQRLADLLQSCTASAEYHEFAGAHEIPLDVIQKLDDFLQRTWESA